MLRDSIGVVTVTYNSSGFLDEFIACCNNQTFRNFRVYCIDNNSTDDTVNLLNKIRDERWRISVNRDNRGVAAGNNQGIIQALRDNCEWVLLLNNDTSFSADCFEKLIGCCSVERWLVAVPKIYFDKPKGHIWYGGGNFSRMKGYSGQHLAMGELDVGQVNQRNVVEYAPTCAMLVHRSVFERVGLMDEAYFVYFDDTDFCWRLKQAGAKIGYNPDAAIVHKVGGSTGGDRRPFTVRFTSRNRMFYIRKHFGVVRAIAWTPVFLGFYLVRFVTGRWGLSCLRASFEGTFSYFGLRTVEPDLRAELRKGTAE